MLYKTLSAAVYGIDANIIQVEVDCSGIKCDQDHFHTFCELSADCERLLERAMTQQGLSARAHDRILKVARTVADREDSPHLEPKHIAEAIQYRSLDRTYWA